MLSERDMKAGGAEEETVSDGNCFPDAIRIALGKGARFITDSRERWAETIGFHQLDNYKQQALGRDALNEENFEELSDDAKLFFYYDWRKYRDAADPRGIYLNQFSDNQFPLRVQTVQDFRSVIKNEFFWFDDSGFQAVAEHWNLTILFYYEEANGKAYNGIQLDPHRVLAACVRFDNCTERKIVILRRYACSWTFHCL